MDKIREIKNNLEAEVSLLEKLVDLAIEKREHIIEKDSEKLSQNIVKAEVLVKRVYQKIEERKVIYNQLGFSGNLVEFISEKVLDVEKTQWLDLLEKRKELTKKLQKEESLNKKLIEDQLELVQFMLKLIQPSQETKVNTYNRYGKTTQLGNVIGVNFRG